MFGMKKKGAEEWDKFLLCKHCSEERYPKIQGTFNKFLGEPEPMS